MAWIGLAPTTAEIALTATPAGLTSMVEEAREPQGPSPTLGDAGSGDCQELFDE